MTEVTKQMSVMDAAKKESEKYKEAPSKIRKVTKNVVEIGVQSAVVSALAPGAAAGVGQIYTGMLPVMTMKGITDDMTEGGAVVIPRNFNKLVEKEMSEHPWLTRKQAEQVVREHSTGDESIVGTSRKLAEKYNTMAFRHEMKCSSCAVVFPPGTNFNVISGHSGLMVACPTCPGLVHAK